MRRAVVPDADADVALGVECAFPAADRLLGHRDRRRIRWRRLARIAIVLAGVALLWAGLRWLGSGGPSDAAAAGRAALVHKL